MCRSCTRLRRLDLARHVGSVVGCGSLWPPSVAPSVCCLNCVTPVGFVQGDAAGFVCALCGCHLQRTSLEGDTPQGALGLQQHVAVLISVFELLFVLHSMATGIQHRQQE